MPPIGSILGAVVAAALCATVPFRAVDQEAATRARGMVATSQPHVIAVSLDGEDATAVAAMARVAGAVRVLGPSIEPLPTLRAAPIARLPARALLDGQAPVAGRTVVIDQAGRAEARAADLAAGALTPAPKPLRFFVAALAALLAYAAAHKPRYLLGLVPLAAVTLALGPVPPLAELGLVAVLAVYAYQVDRARDLARTLDAVSGPLLRATAAAPRPSVIGPALADTLHARGLLVIETPPGARVARIGKGWRLGAADLQELKLDPRRAPFRDAAGIARPTDASQLIGRPSMLLPLATRGVVEGYLIVTPGRGLESQAEITLAACAEVAEELRLARVRTQSRGALLEAAASLEERVVPTPPRLLKSAAG